MVPSNFSILPLELLNFLFSIQDSTFEFEKRRNRPVRYNRETMEQTLRAMRRVSEVKHKRQDMFFKMRMQAHKGKQREQVRAEIKKGIDLLVPKAADREKAIANATRNITSRHALQKAAKAAKEIRREPESKMQN